MHSTTSSPRRFAVFSSAPTTGDASAKSLAARRSYCRRCCSMQNDPFLPAHSLPHDNEVSAQSVPDFPREGGHVGNFVTGSLPGRLDGCRCDFSIFEQQK